MTIEVSDKTDDMLQAHFEALQHRISYSNQMVERCQKATGTNAQDAMMIKQEQMRHARLKG